MKLRIFVVLLLLICLLIPQVTSQNETCDAIARRTLASIDEICEGTGRNQICYGNDLIEAELHENADSIGFDDPGDIVDVMSVRSLSSSPMDEEQGVWGVMLMQLQADLPSSVPGQNVTFILFGDTQMHNGAADGAHLEATANGGSNIRSGPSTDYAVVGGLENGEELTVIGRLGDASWVQIIVPDSNRTGWVFANLLAIEGDTDDLAVVNPDETSQSNGLQAFYFSTGIGDSPCAAAPNSGILIRTPEGAGKINLNLNEVNISLGSTVFVQATDEFRINVLEGSAEVEAFEEEQTALENMRIRVELDETGAAAAPPSPPERCDPNDIRGVPGASSNDCLTVEVGIDSGCPITVPSGMSIFFYSYRTYASREQAEANRTAVGGSIMIDGETVLDVPSGVYRQRYSNPPEFWYRFHYVWEGATPGTHTVTSTGPGNTIDGLPAVRTCVINVVG